jgi:hypothetical protein
VAVGDGGALDAELTSRSESACDKLRVDPARRPSHARSKLHVDQTKKDRQHSAQFGKDGKTRMFPEQAAGLVKSGITGKAQTAAPGAQSAKGGNKEMKYVPSKPAKPGITSPR